MKQTTTTKTLKIEDITFRAITGKDLMYFLRVVKPKINMNKIFSASALPREANEFVKESIKLQNRLKNPDLADEVKAGLEDELAYANYQINQLQTKNSLEIVNYVLDVIPLAEKEIYDLLEDLTGETAEDLINQSALFQVELIQKFTKEGGSDFFTSIKKLLAGN